MLSYEDGIVDHGDLAKCKLGRVTSDAAPIMLKVAINALLADAEDATSEVEEDLHDAPALGALVFIVEDHLRHVFDKGDDEFDIAYGVDNVKGYPVDQGIISGGRSNKHVGKSDTGDAAGGDAKDEAARTVVRAHIEAPERVEEILGRYDEREDDAMEGKGDVVELDGGLEAVIPGGILSTDFGGVVECSVGNKVCKEACAKNGMVSDVFHVRSRDWQRVAIPCDGEVWQ